MAMASYCGISRIGKPTKTNNIKQSETAISSPALCPFQEALGCMQVSGPSQCSQSFSKAIYGNIHVIQSLTIAIVFELIYYTNGHSRV